VKHVCDLIIRAVHKNQVATDEHVNVIRRWRRQHDLEFMWAGLHVRAQANGKDSLDHEVAFLNGRETVPLRESGRQVAVVRLVPASNVMIVVAVSLVTSVVVAMSMVSIAVVIAIMVTIAAMIVVIAIVLVMAVTVVLSNSDRGTERQRQQSCSDAAHV
jgi:hypothetical protein